MAKTEIPQLSIHNERIELDLCYPEVEDKYIIPRPSERFLAYTTRSEIRQGYLPDGIRLREERKSDGTIEYSGVFKDRQNARRRKEYTAVLSKSQFDFLWKKVEAIIIKTRHKIATKKYIIDVDEFHGVLSGKWMAEVEAEKEKDLDSFEKDPPKIFQQEFGFLTRLTNGQRKQFTSRILAYNGWPEVEIEVIA